MNLEVTNINSKIKNAESGLHIFKLIRREKSIGYLHDQI